MLAAARREHRIGLDVAVPIAEAQPVGLTDWRVRIDDTPAGIMRAEREIVVRVLSPPCIDLIEIGRRILEAVRRRRHFRVRRTREDRYPCFRVSTRSFV